MSASYSVDGLVCQVLPDALVDATVVLAEKFMADSLLGMTGLANHAAEVAIRAGLRGEDLSFALEDVQVAVHDWRNAVDGEHLRGCEEELSSWRACGCEDRARDLVADAASVVWARARLVCPAEVDTLIEAAS